MVYNSNNAQLDLKEIANEIFNKKTDPYTAVDKIFFELKERSN